MNIDEHDEESSALAEDEVLDVIGVDEGLPHEEQTNGNWTWTDFENAGLSYYLIIMNVMLM